MEDQIQAQKQDLQFTCTPQSKQTSNQNLVSSEYLQQYDDFFTNENSQSHSQDFIKKLTSNSLMYKLDQFSPQLHIRLAKLDKSCKMVIFKISYGYFQLQISAIHTLSKSCLHSPKLRSIGSKQSNIILFAHKDKKYAVKCIPITQKKLPMVILVQTIKQYSLLKIASSLGIGPPMSKYFGFELFIHKDCIQFIQQQCQNIKEWVQILDSSHIESLKYKLRSLHSLKIVHMDIKPDNIMYCRLKEEFVFIDFGFSKVLEEDIGFKSSTAFAGTLSYCSPEMAALSVKQTAFIDLYYNDMYSLRAALRELTGYKRQLNFNEVEARKNSKVCQQSQHSQNSQEEYISILNKLLLLKLKYQTFNNNQRFLKEKEFQQLILNNIPEVISFISEQKLTKTVQKIYQFVLKHSNCDLAYLQSFINIQEIKQHQIMLLGREVHFDFNKFLSFFSNKKDKLQTIHHDYPHISLKVDENIELQMEFKVNQYLKQPKYKLFTHFCHFVDFRSSYSTIHQKIRASQQLIAHLKLIKQHFFSYSHYQSLEFCFRHILKHFSQTLDPDFQEIIPLTIINLVIMQGFQAEELRNQIKQLLLISCDELRYLKMLFKLNFLAVWIYFKHQFQAKIQQTTKIIISDIANALLDIAVKTKAKKTKFIVMLILLDERRKFPEEELEKIAQEVQFLDTGDQQLTNQLKIHFFIWKMQIQKGLVYFYQFINIIYEINEIDPQIVFHPKKIDYFHIKLFYFFQTYDDNYILADIYSRLQKCFTGTGILKKFRLYYTYRPQALKSDNLQVRMASLQAEELPIHEYQTVYQYHQILEKVSQLQENSVIKPKLLDKIQRVFNVQFMLLIRLPQQEQHKIKEFFATIVLIAKIYILLYTPESQQIILVLQLTNQLQNYLSTLSCQDCQLKGNFLLLQVKWRLSRHTHRYQDAISYNIAQIKLLTENKVIQNEDLKFIFFDIRKIIELITIMKVYSLEKLKASKNIHFVCQTINKYKLQLYGLAHTQGLSIFKFQCWFTLVIKSSLPQFFEFNSELLNLIYQYPDKRYINKYEKYFEAFIIEYLSWWKHSAAFIIDYLFTHFKSLSLNPLICLFLSFLFRFCNIRDPFFGKLKYYICKDMDYINVRAKTITLSHFFTYLVSMKKGMGKKRAKSCKTRKFASYISWKQFTEAQFFQKMGICRATKEQKNVFCKKIRRKLKIFHQTVI